MPLFLIERNLAEQMVYDQDAAIQVNLVNEDVGVNWLFSFLSADRKKTYCLYEAPNADAIREAARRNGFPADVIIEVSDEIRRGGTINPLVPSSFTDVWNKPQ